MNILSSLHARHSPTNFNKYFDSLSTRKKLFRKNCFNGFLENNKFLQQNMQHALIISKD